jgi:hypothetical protein
LAGSEEGLRFRDAARAAIGSAAEGPAGALQAADVVLLSAAEYKKGMKEELKEDLAPFLDDRGQPEEAYRGSIRRLEIRFQRRERRAERDYVDWVLLGVSALLRDAIAAEVGGGIEVLLNPDLAGEAGGARLPVVRAARGMAAVEEARAALAEDINLNTRLVLERAFLRLGDEAAA